MAIYSTKLPILMNDGFWKMAHDSRNDACMVLARLFLLVVGAGACSLDARLTGRNAAR